MILNIDDVQFPKLILCSNGIHSEWKIRSRYPELSFEALNELYTGKFHKRGADNYTLQLLKSIDFEEFSRNTFSDIFMVGCLFMNRKCSDRWTYHYTMFGLCLKFDGRHVGKMVAYGRKAQLSFVGIYNETDSRAGWYQYYSGFTLFYSHPYEDTLDQSCPKIWIFELPEKLD